MSDYISMDIRRDRRLVKPKRYKIQKANLATAMKTEGDNVIWVSAINVMNQIQNANIAACESKKYNTLMPHLSGLYTSVQNEFNDIVNNNVLTINGIRLADQEIAKAITNHLNNVTKKYQNMRTVRQDTLYNWVPEKTYGYYEARNDSCVWLDISPKREDLINAYNIKQKAENNFAHDRAVNSGIKILKIEEIDYV